MQSTDYRKWVIRAQENLDISIDWFNNMNPIPKEEICFHIYFGVEFILKACILYNKGWFKMTRKLVKLSKLCLKHNPNLVFDNEKLLYIETNGANSEFPSAIKLDDEVPKLCIEYAKEIYKMILDDMGYNKN